jgi:hypothetical protein
MSFWIWVAIVVCLLHMMFFGSRAPWSGLVASNGIGWLLGGTTGATKQPDAASHSIGRHDHVFGAGHEAAAILLGLPAARTAWQGANGMSPARQKVKER